jgi:hypothetical protein
LFGHEVLVSLPDRWLHAVDTEAASLLERMGQHVALSTLWYLVGARDVPLSGRLVKPNDMPGGDIYERGTHVLPLDRVSGEYGEDVGAFVARGRALNGEQLEYADASIRLFPFPRIAAAVLLWAKDAEFSARASLLIDDSCRHHLPMDIVWSVSMMSVLAML